MVKDQKAYKNNPNNQPRRKEVLSFFKTWLISDFLIALAAMSVAKQNGAEYYLISFFAVMFLALLPLAITVGLYYFGVTKIANGFVFQGSFYRSIGLFLSILVGIYFIKTR
jgi:hypothetical protein